MLTKEEKQAVDFLVKAVFIKYTNDLLTADVQNAMSVVKSFSESLCELFGEAKLAGRSDIVLSNNN